MSSDHSSSGSVPVRVLPENERTKGVTEAFIGHFNRKPEFYVQVPGRVNLIGEHIDYCGYSVCPMALQQDILMAVAVDDHNKLLHLHNVDPKFEDYQCDLDRFEISVGEGAPQWYQYFLCGLKGILETLPEPSTAKGLKVTVSGNVPQSAGLSSSSALVSAAALAAAYAFDCSLSKEKIASLCADCERYIGTQGGGMDQAIAFLATEGCAKLIDFSPLRASDVTLPEDAVFVVAHSMTRLNKASTADFNRRVIECRIAAQIIAKKKDLPWQSTKKLGDLQQALGVDLPEMISITEQILHEQPYTKDEIVGELETTPGELENTSLTSNTKHVETFKLRQRAMHVFNEALRVRKFHQICKESSGRKALEILGRLMSQSHDSLRDLYECSHPQLDRLVEMSKGFTLGTRLTGAGWGGCTVSLLVPENVEGYINHLKENFYRPLGVEDKLQSLVFATAPKSGASVYLEKKN